MFHTIGDSHASNIHSAWKVFGNKIISHHIGPCLAFSFGRDKLKRINFKKLKIQENDTVCLCLGEIDIRCHIFKIINKFKNSTYQEVIDNIIDKYILAIKENKKQYKNIKICIYNVVPPKFYEKGMRHNPEFPFLGSNKDRLNYTKYFNSKLKQECDNNDYTFIDIYEKYSDENGYLDITKSDSSVHITNGEYLNDYLTNELKLI